VFGDGIAKAKVTRLASSKGSLDTEFTANDMAKLGIAPRSRFTATCKGKAVDVLYGTTYFDVPQGGWVAFIVADGGHLRLARNYADAVTELGCGLGDEVSIKPLQGGEE
jgi:S-adenosylmethionine hydrolase